jgi:Bacterial PH domain
MAPTVTTVHRSPTTIWRPRRSAGGRVGLAASVGALGVALAAAAWATQQPVGLAMFGGLVAAVLGLVLTVLLAVWTYGYYTLRYVLDGEALTIDWLFRQDRLPYRSIDAVYAGQRMTESLRVRGITWPGYYVGRGRARNLGVLRVFASALHNTELTLVLSELGGYALSPDDAFRATLIERLQAARQAPAAATAARGGPRSRNLGRALADPWLLVSALVSLGALLAMLGYVMDRYESLPELLALRLDALGEPERIRPRFELFYLPAVGAATLLINLPLGVWLYQWEPLAARMLWLAPLLVQLVLAVAVVRTIG